LLLPQNFIPHAEETGLIVPIGNGVMREACSFNKSLQDRGLPAMSVGCILFLRRQLARYELVRAVEQSARCGAWRRSFSSLE